MSGAESDTLRGNDGDDWLLDQFPVVSNVVRARIPGWLMSIFYQKAAPLEAEIEPQLRLEGR